MFEGLDRSWLGCTSGLYQEMAPLYLGEKSVWTEGFTRSSRALPRTRGVKHQMYSCWYIEWNLNVTEVCLQLYTVLVYERTRSALRAIQLQHLLLGTCFIYMKTTSHSTGNLNCWWNKGSHTETRYFVYHRVLGWMPSNYRANKICCGDGLPAQWSS